LDVRLDQVEAVRFVREPSPFPSFPGEESLTVRFEAAEGAVLFCYLEGLYDGRRLRPERLEVWEQLGEHYGGRELSIVDNGSLLPIAAAA
jgi:putative heme iron utilization protein